MVTGFILFPKLLPGRYFSIQDYVYDFLLLPRGGEMVMNVAWTLRNEFIFYAIFFISIIAPFVRLKFILLWQLLVMFATLTAYKANSPVLATVLSTYNIGFGAGILAAYLAITRPTGRPAIFIVIGITSFVVILGVDWYLGRTLFLPHASPALGEVVGPVLLTFSSALIVFGFASLERKAPIAPVAVITILGASSYVLYLTHSLLSSFLVRILHFSLPMAWPWIILLILIASAIVAAIALHLVVERPTLDFLRRGGAQHRAAKYAGVIPD